MKRKILVLIVACLLTSLGGGAVVAEEPEPGFRVSVAVDWLLELLGIAQPSQPETGAEVPPPPSSLPLKDDSPEPTATDEPDPGTEIGPGMDPWG